MLGTRYVGLNVARERALLSTSQYGVMLSRKETILTSVSCKRAEVLSSLFYGFIQSIFVTIQFILSPTFAYIYRLMHPK